MRFTWPSALAWISSTVVPSPSISVLASPPSPPPQPAATTHSAPTSRPNASHRAPRLLRAIRSSLRLVDHRFLLRTPPHPNAASLRLEHHARVVFEVLLEHLQLAASV